VVNDDFHRGGCLCGAVRYRAVVGESSTVTHCHCGMCRKVSGATLATWAEFPAENFEFTQGQPKVFRSSDIAERAFCGSCGCQLTFWAVGDPGGVSERIWVAVGSTDQPAAIKPTHHIFTDDKLPRLRVDDSLPASPRQLPSIRADDDLAIPTQRGEGAISRSGLTPEDDGSQEGGCLCGSVRYRATIRETETVAHCHCGMCRKASGGTLVSWIDVATKDFAFTRGQPAHFKSSHIAERTFCGTCGCQFTFQFIVNPEEDSEILWLTLGSTNRPEDFEFACHIFTDDQLPWLHFDDQLERWPNQFPGLRSDEGLARRGRQS